MAAIAVWQQKPFFDFDIALNGLQTVPAIMQRVPIDDGACKVQRRLCLKHHCASRKIDSGEKQQHGRHEATTNTMGGILL